MSSNIIKSITLEDGEKSFTFDGLNIEKNQFGCLILTSTKGAEDIPSLVDVSLDYGISAANIAGILTRNGDQIDATIEALLHKHIDLECIVGLISRSSRSYARYCVKQFIENGYTPEEIVKNLIKYDLFDEETYAFLESEGLSLTTLFQYADSSTAKKFFDKFIAAGIPINNILDKISYSCHWCIYKGVDKLLKKGANPETVLKAMLPVWEQHIVDQKYTHKLFTAIVENKTNVLCRDLYDDHGGPLFEQAVAIMYFATGYLKFIKNQEK